MAIDEHVFLTGRPPMGEFLGFVTGQSVTGRAQDLSELAERWRLAHDHIQRLEDEERGAADSPLIANPPSELAPLIESLKADPIYQRSFQVVPADISIVNLNSLVVFQKSI